MADRLHLQTGIKAQVRKKGVSRSPPLPPQTWSPYLCFAGLSVRLVPLPTPSYLACMICNRCGVGIDARDFLRGACAACLTSTQAHPLFSLGSVGTRSDTLWCACPNDTHTYTIGCWTPSREVQRYAQDENLVHHPIKPQTTISNPHCEVEASHVQHPSVIWTPVLKELTFKLSKTSFWFSWSTPVDTPSHTVKSRL